MSPEAKAFVAVIADYSTALYNRETLRTKGTPGEFVRANERANDLHALLEQRFDEALLPRAGAPNTPSTPSAPVGPTAQDALRWIEELLVKAEGMRTSVPYDDGFIDGLRAAKDTIEQNVKQR